MDSEARTRPYCVDRVDDLLPGRLHLEWSVMQWAEAVILHDERRHTRICLWNSEIGVELTLEYLVQQMEELTERLEDSTETIREFTDLSQAEADQDG